MGHPQAGRCLSASYKRVCVKEFNSPVPYFNYTKGGYDAERTVLGE
jgi:hypothetical protein